MDSAVLGPLLRSNRLSGVEGSLARDSLQILVNTLIQRRP